MPMPQANYTTVAPAYAQSPAAWTVHPGQPPLAFAARPLVYAGFWRRLGANLIDVFLFILFWVALGVVLAIAAPDADMASTEAVLNLIGLLVCWVYYANMESGPRQSTFGQRALGLRVCDTQGQPVSFGRASGRYFGKFISTILLFVGFLMIAFTERKQGLHDLMASTLVVRVGE